MDIPLESIIERSSFKVADKSAIVSQGEAWEEVRLKTEAYLRAWNLLCDAEVLSELLRAAKERVAVGSGKWRTEIAIEEADKYVVRRANQILPGGTSDDENKLSLEQRLAILTASPEEEPWLDAAMNCEAARQKLQRAFTPQRPLETYPMKMRTSLSRIPSIGLISGWAAFILLLVLIFIFTHR